MSALRTAALLTLLTATAALAEEEAPSSRRELAGHTFAPTPGITSAFAATRFGTYLTMGYGSTTGSFTLTLPDGSLQTFSGSVEYAAVGGLLTYELAFLEGFSARVTITETIYSGTTGASVATVGTNVRAGLGLGLTWSIPVTESLRLAVIADASTAPRFTLLIGAALRDAYDRCQADPSNCSFDFSKLFQQNDVVQLRPGVAAAWAPTPSLGVSANVAWVQLTQQQVGGDSASAGTWDLGLALDFDLGKLTTVPLGLQATVASQIPVSGQANARFTDLGTAILYTGRKDLSAGVHLVVRRFKVVPEVDVSWSTFVMFAGLTYYW